MNKTGRMQKIIKFIGKLLSVIAICFVVYKFIQIDFNWKEVLNVSNILICVGLILLQVAVIVTACYPWMSFVEILADKKIEFKKAMVVFTKANIFKYVPGNVFQYVARNELASVAELSHVDVAMATILDTVLSLAVAFVLSLCCLQGTVFTYIKNSGISAKKIVAVLLIGILILGVVIIALYKRWLKDKIKTYFKRINAKNGVHFLKILAYYLFKMAANCFNFFCIVAMIFGQNNSMNDMYRLMGSFVFSLIAGMITPGASGGIGIRESVMMFITEGAFDSSIIVSSMVLLRVISIFGDVLAFLVGKGVCVVSQKNCER